MNDVRASVPIHSGAGTEPGFPQFRVFLRALAEELDSEAGASGRDSLLRGVGRQMARMLPLPAVASMSALEMEMNDVLGSIGWGHTRLELLETERHILITHAGLPRIGSAGDPPGTWLAGVLEGLYEAWMSQQPGSDAGLVARRQPHQETKFVVLRYGRV